MKKVKKNIELVHGNYKDFLEIYPNFVKEFPRYERKSMNHIKELLRKDCYELILAIDKLTKLRIGYALIYKIEQEKSLWLDYIVIEKQHQGKGYGTIMFEKILDLYEDCYAGIFLEVEIPSGYKPDQERRLKFYEKLGAKHSGIDYKIPTNEGGFPMYLLFKGFKNDILPSKERLKSVIKSVYGCIHSDISCVDEIYKKLVKKLEV